MRILFVTSDWAFTGPADPMLRALTALRARGHTVELACPESPQVSEPGVAGVARGRGVDPQLVLARARGIHPWRDRRDARRLRALVERDRPRIVHAWHSRGHGLAWWSSRELRGRAQSALVRSHRAGEPIASWPWNRWLFGPACDGLWCVSPGAADANRALRRGRPIGGALGGIDPERFAASEPQRRAARAALRAEIGAGAEAPVFGVVARVQRQRRFDLLLRAFARLVDREHGARLVVLGRGTHLDEVARRPVRELGLHRHVHFLGHRSGAQYVAALQGLDALTFLVPGSDGGCRAVLEAAAAGIPCIATRRGALPEIVLDGRTGLLVEEDANALARAWHGLLAEPERRRALGRAAEGRARDEFGADALAQNLEGFYAEVLESAGVSPPPSSS